MSTKIERWMLKCRPHAIGSVYPSVEFEDALQLDREIFGADRSALLRSLADAAPEFTRVVRQEARVDGYIFGRRGSHADHLGPWVARNGNVAEMLLVEFLMQSNRELVFVDCLPRNPWTLPLLGAHHFRFSRPLTRMFRGKNIFAGKPELLFAVIGPEFG